VPSFRVSSLAESDLAGIAAYTLRTWGPDQTDRYLSDIEARFQLLANSPGVGRPCDGIRRGLRRAEHAKHVIFYRLEPGGIFVSRILHEHMLPIRHAEFPE